MNRKVTLTIDVEYDGDITDPDFVASALDKLMETATSTSGILDECGPLQIGEFYPPQTNALSEMSYADLFSAAVSIEITAASYRHDRHAINCLHEDRLKYRAEVVKKGLSESDFKEDVRIECERLQKLEEKADD